MREYGRNNFRTARAEFAGAVRLDPEDIEAVKELKRVQARLVSGKQQGVT